MAHGIAVIGLGIMGRRMIARLRQHDAFRITAICDPAPDGCAAAGREVPEATIEPDPAAIAARADTSCVYIAWPPASHPELCHRMFDAGKAVFCEKPLTHDLAVGATLAARARDERRSGAVNFSMASSPSFKAVVAAVESARLDGKPHTLPGFDEALAVQRTIEGLLA